MSTNANSPLSFKANSALSAFRLVALSSNGYVGLAAATDRPVGVNQFDISSDTFATASVESTRGSIVAIAATAVPVTAGNLVYAAADGRVAYTGTVLVGIACEGTTVADTTISVVLI